MHKDTSYEDDQQVTCVTVSSNGAQGTCRQIVQNYLALLL